MSNLRQVQRKIALAVGLGLGILACLGTTEARDFDATPSSLGPYQLQSNASVFETGALPFETFEFKLESAAPIDEPRDKPVRRRSEPFGQSISPPVKGGLENKWSAVKRQLRHEGKVLRRCRADAASCPPVAKRFLAIVDKAMSRHGWRRIAEINRSINLSIRPMSDMAQYGVVDLWATPFMTLSSGAGDCEDYSIAKYVALREIGIAEDDIRLVVVHDRAANEDHAVAAVRYDGRWQILDNRTLDIRRDVDIAEFDPLFVMDRQGVKRIAASAPKPPGPWANLGTAAAQLQLSAADSNSFSRPWMPTLQ